jgi:hypothetical protein
MTSEFAALERLITIIAAQSGRRFNWMRFLFGHAND